MLYVVSTPIGNMEDVTLRAIRILGEVDMIAAEDTRYTGKLLAYHNINNRLISYHDHNEAERTPGLIKRLKGGSSVALVSNAGTPSVSDPGYRLIKTAIDNGIAVTPVPGVSAAVAALSVAGLPTDSFVFVGFPAKRKPKRLSQLKQLAEEKRTMIFYQSPRRIPTFIEEIIQTMGDRFGVLSREMTKRHEEFIRNFLSEILRDLRKRPSIKGECTLLVAGRQEEDGIEIELIRSEITKRLQKEEVRLSDIVKQVSLKYGLPKNRVYDEALKLKRES